MWPLPYFFTTSVTTPSSASPAIPGYVTVTELLDSLLLRARDTQAVGVTRPEALWMLGEALQFVCASRSLVVSEADFTLPAGTYFYNPNAAIGDYYHAVDLRCFGRDLPHARFRTFERANPTLLTKRGVPMLWSRLGWNLLFIWPAPENDTLITLRYTPSFTDLAEGDSTTIREEDAPAVLEAALILLLLRFRKGGTRE